MLQVEWYFRHSGVNDILKINFRDWRALGVFVLGAAPLVFGVVHLHLIVMVRLLLIPSVSEDGDSSEMDDEDCERRRMECLDEMSNLEKQFTDLKDQ